MKTIILHKGTMLYHGTVSGVSMPNNIPNRYGGSWFARLKRQAIYWSIFKRSTRNEPVVYTYRVKKDVQIIRLDDASNVEQLSRNTGFTKVFKYTYNGKWNGLIAERLCRNGKYNGWELLSGQTQVMLCRPSEFLEFVKKEYVHSNVLGNTPIGALNNKSFMYVNRPVYPMNLKLTNTKPSPRKLTAGDWRNGYRQAAARKIQNAYRRYKRVTQTPKTINRTPRTNTSK
jgi:hypothetical protein